MRQKYLLVPVLLFMLICGATAAPIYVYNNSWSQVAAQTVSQTQIRALIQYDDGTGNAIYGGVYPNDQINAGGCNLSNLGTLRFGTWQKVTDL